MDADARELASYGEAVARPNARQYGSRASVSQLPSLPDLPKQQATEAARTPDTSYVEFDLSNSHEACERQIVAKPSSVPPLPTKEILELKGDDDDFFSDRTTVWKDMKKVSSFDYYNDRGELEVVAETGKITSFDDVQAYTKIDTEEQIAKYTELNKQTDFLFAIQKPKQHQRANYADDSDDLLYSEDENLDSEETLAGTKGMLSEAQKFAYVGIAKLIAVDMATELARLIERASPSILKPLNVTQKNFANWTMYVMSKLYEHMDLSKEEKQMIENLSLHGVEVTDLSTSLMEAPRAKFDLRWVLICDLFLLLLSDGYYDSRLRTLLVQFAQHLGVGSLDIHQFERRLIESLELDTSNKTIENKDELLNDRLFIEKHIKQNKKTRMAYIGLATLGGSLAIGLSAGLLAPVIGAGIAAGLTTVGIGGTGGFLAGVGGSAIITTGGVLTGAKMGSKAGNRRAGEVNTFEFKPLHNNKRTNLIITVSGWMIGKADDVRLPFSTVDPVMGDMFSLLWEPEMLQLMGQTIGILASEALSTSIQQILGATILTALMSAIQLPMALSKLTYLLDNPWNVSLDRAWKAGKILADTLIAGNMGVRPITLVGFSLGSRVIYCCLIELAKRGGHGLIENVILLGNPIAVKTDQIILARSVVSGRFINGYSRKDWILGYLFRATGGGISTVAGLSPIEGINGVENVDCTDLVEGHMAYRQAIPKILKRLEWEMLSEEFAEIEEPDPEQRERQRKLIDEFDEAKAKMEQENDAPQKKTWKDWFKPKPKEWWDYVDELKDDKEPKNDPTEEYEGPIFDVGALMDEVTDIQKLGTKDEATLEKVRGDVLPDIAGPDDLKPPPVSSNVYLGPEGPDKKDMQAPEKDTQEETKVEPGPTPSKSSPPALPVPRERD